MVESQVLGCYDHLHPREERQLNGLNQRSFAAHSNHPYAAYQVLSKRFVSSWIHIRAPHPPVPSTRARYEPILADAESPFLSSYALNTHSSSANNGSTLPFGLYPNLLTSGIGVVTFLALWPILVLLHWLEAEKSTLPADGRIWGGIAGIALGGVTFNSGYMVPWVSTYHVAST